VLVILEPSHSGGIGSESSLEWIFDDMLEQDLGINYLNNANLEGFIFCDEANPVDEEEAAKGYVAIKIYEKVR
jgi:hypothetical protein